MLPNNLKVPFMYVSFDPSRAFEGSSVLSYKNLLIAERLDSGSKNPLKFDLVLNPSQASKFYGQGSMSHLMCKKYFENNKYTPLIVCSVNDTGSQAQGSIVVSGTASNAGSIYLMIDGVSIPVQVDKNDSNDDIASQIASTINSNGDLPVTASSTGDTCDITAKQSGTLGNDFDIRVNYYSGEELPDGINLTLNSMSGGSGEPDIQSVIDIMGEEWYNVIITSLSSASNLSKLDSELSDRFSAMRMIDGVGFVAKRDTVSNLVSFGSSLNSPHLSVMNGGEVPNHPAEIASSYAGKVSKEGSVDPARPFQTLELDGILSPELDKRNTISENNLLLNNGISTYQVSNDGTMRIQRAITTYQENEAGVDDIAYLDVNTMLTLMYLRYDFRNTILTKYPRAKLADDATRINAGQQVMTPKIGKSEAVSIFRNWESMGLVENLDQFKEDIICKRSNTDPNRLDWVISPDLVNQFRVGNAVIQFLL